MSDAVSISIVTSTSTAVIAGVSAYFAYKAKVQAKATHLLVNSRMDKLLELTQTSSKAEGKLEEKTEEKARVDKEGSNAQG